jgi:uncharacterized protein with FMN-binding domain
MPATIRLRAATAAFASLATLGVLAGCATDDGATTDTDTTEDGGTTTESDDTSTGSSDDATTDESADGGDSASGYVDGTYEATGTYTSPGGTESIDVSLTLEDGIVTAVEVTSNAENPNSVRYQTAFISGIEAEVVGVAIDDLDVDRVSGSSLTSTGFDDAVAQIQDQAAA